MADEVQRKGFLKNMKQELKKVIWPTSAQTAKNTVAVIVIVILVSAMVLLFDVIFRKSNDLIVDKVTGGKVTEYKIEVQAKNKILNEIKEIATDEEYAQYAQIAYYLDAETLQSMLDQLKEDKANQQTEDGATTEENTETEATEENTEVAE